MKEEVSMVHLVTPTGHFSCHDSSRHTDTIFSCFLQPWPSLVKEHTLQWHNLHAWPCSPRTRHISLLQHTSRLLIFLSLPLSKMKQLSLLIMQRPEDKVNCRSDVRGWLSSQMAPKQAVFTLCLQEHLTASISAFPTCPDRIFPLPSCAQGWEESDSAVMYSLYTSPVVIKKLLGDSRGKPISLNHLHI